MPGPSLGTNLHGLVDWNTGFPFINLFRMSRPWYTQSDGQFDTGHADLLDLDEQGWVRHFTEDGSAAPFERVSTILFTAGQTAEGTYVLDWQGTGTVDLDFVPDDAILERTDHSITVHLAQGTTLQVSIISTDPGNTGDYLRDIRLYNADHRELIDSGAVFSPEFLEKIAGFRALRFMDWMATNNSPISDWGDMRPGDAARETNFGDDARGASVETMVALANETNADPWFTLPHLATDEYIREFATYVRDHLETGLTARFEFSNEVWNWLFDQSHHAQAQAEALWGAGVEGGWMQWYGMRAARMAEIVAEVFGDETGTRAQNVFSTQAGWQGLEHYALNAPDYVAAGGTPPRDAPFHIYAIAPYFGGAMGLPEHAALVDGWLAAGQDGFQQAIDWIRNGDAADCLANIGSVIAYHAEVAKGLGWQLEAYEGGQHVVDFTQFTGGEEDAARTQFFVDLVRQPEFEALYIDYFNIWKDSGGGLMAHFSDFGVGDRYGSWGIWDSAYSSDTPRAKAVEDFRDHVDAWWEDSRDASTFLNGVTRADGDGRDLMHGTMQDDRLSALDGNNAVYGGAGNDWIAAREGHDTLHGGRGVDVVLGEGGTDDLLGGGGRDLLQGGSGDDYLTGGLGQDLLQGDSGADLFQFQTVADSRRGTADVILDFVTGEDMIGLQAITGGQGIWRATDPFTATGQTELRYAAAQDGIRLLVDLDGDGAADMAIRLAGIDALSSDDILL